MRWPGLRVAHDHAPAPFAPVTGFGASEAIASMKAPTPVTCALVPAPNRPAARFAGFRLAPDDFSIDLVCYKILISRAP